MQQQSARAEFVPLGGERRGYYAVPAGPGPFPAVLVYQEAYGVNDYVQSEVRRLAANGYAAIAPDLFHGRTFAYDDFGPVKEILESLRDEAMMEDVRAAVAFLDAQTQVNHQGYGAVGFCMGGRLALLTAIELGPDILAAASFYGGNVAPEQQRFFVPLLDRLAAVRAELLLIYGADDESIAPREHARIVERLSSEKKSYTLSVFPGAGHAFASRDRASYRPEQAEKAWSETFALFARTLRSSR
jgi:carboxymethylenebutenolidase